MKTFLQFFFAGICLGMTAVTIAAGLELSLWEAWPDFAENPWAVATLYDAYFGFLIFYAWVAYKESGFAARLLWFVLIMGLGNIATSFYAFLQVRRHPDQEPLETVLWTRA